MASQVLELHRLNYNQFRCRDCHTVHTRYQVYEQGRYEDMRCYDCYYAHKERTVNPIQMGNRHNHLFNGSDMRYYRFTVRDNGNLLTVREAKKLGMVCKREGRLSRYYDAHGTLLCAYSYNTCIYARVFDSVEGYWRDVFNFTPYSKTTNEHVGTVTWEILGIGHWQWVEGRISERHYTDDWTYTHTTHKPLSERARRAVELVRVETDTTAEELVAMVGGVK